MHVAGCIMRSTFQIAFVALTVSLAGLPACAENQDDDDADYAEPADGDGLDDSKSDQPDLALTPVEFGGPVRSNDVEVGVIKSKAAWKHEFGVAAPSSINFKKDWVVYYSAGLQSTGGFDATIAHVRLSDSGKSLKITTHLDTPGSDCLVTKQLTRPFAIVKFHKPFIAPTTNRFTSETQTRSCSTPAPTCAAAGGTCRKSPSDPGFPALCQQDFGVATLEGTCPAFNQACCATPAPKPTCAQAGGTCRSSPFDVGFPAHCQQDFGKATLDATCAAFNQVCCGG